MSGAELAQEVRDLAAEQLGDGGDALVVSQFTLYGDTNGDGKVSNQGREYWQLVRTEQGWKIFSVIYSLRAR